MDGATLERTGKRRRVLEEPERDGRDEMNLAEFPIASLADRMPKDVKTLVFEDEMEDPVTREPVVRRLTISGSDRYGLPTAVDDEVIVALIQVTRRAGFESPTVYFSRYELLRILGWEDEGKNYGRIETAINRWCGVTLYWDNAWWDKEEQAWVNVKFGILDNAVVLDRRRYDRKRKLGQVPLALSSFKWNEVIFRSFQAGNLKHLDMELFRSLRSSVAKRLYRFLDKRFWHRQRWEFDLHQFAFDKIGLSRSYAKNAAKIREKLAAGIEELEASGYLETLPANERYVQLGKGHWKVVFVRRDAKAHPQQTVSREPVNELEQELISRGVGKKVAGELVRQFDATRIVEKIELHDWLLAKKDERIAKNPAGYLATAIREDYPLPKGFKTKAKREAERAALEEKKRKRDAAEAAENAKREAEDAARNQALAEYLAGLTEGERKEFEAKAIDADGGFLRKAWRRNGTSDGLYLHAMLRNYFESLEVVK